MLPRPKGLGFGLDRRPSPAPRGAEFLRRRAPTSGLPQQTVAVASTAEEHAGSVDVGVRAVPARDALEFGLAPATARVDHAAIGARLRAVRRRDLDHRAALGHDLVAQHRHEAAPAAVEDRAVEPGLLAHPRAGLFGRATCARGHAADVQSLDDDRAVALGVERRLAVQDGVALPARLPLQAGHDGPRLLLVLRPLLAARDGALRARELFADALERSRVRHDAAVGIGEQVDHAAVDRDGGLRARERVGLLELDGHAREPGVAVADERAGLRRAAWRPVHDGRHGAELRKHHGATATLALDTEGLRCDDGRAVAALALPARRAAEPLEAALPRLVELDEQLRTQVAWNVREPRQFGAQGGQLVDLVERRGIARVGLAAPLVGHQPLLVGEIPQEPQRVFPRGQALRLRRRRIDAVALASPGQHASSMYWSMPKSNELRRGRHVVFNLNVHLVFVPKYRRSPITARVFAVLRSAWETVCAEFKCELIETNYEPDHVHLLVAYPPKVALSTLVNSLKGVSARRVKAEAFPEVQRVLWGAHFWSPSYCAVSCGGAPLDVVRRYVEQQRGASTSTATAAPPRPEVRGTRRSKPERSK